VGVYLAKKINAEIVSCDSMQVYKGIDIISSKPALSLRKKVPYHLIDILPLNKEYNASRYCKDALKKLKEIIDKGKPVVFVGGTGLYMSLLIDGIFKVEIKDKGIRDRLYLSAKELGSQYLFKRLQAIDPASSLKIHPHDTKRIVRALEVFEGTGKPISELQQQRTGLSAKYDIAIFCLNTNKDILKTRIAKRIDKMFKEGLISEVRHILKKKISRTAQYAIGLRELEGYFDGFYSLEEAKRLMLKNTYLYAKRQLTWFRKDKRIKWINIKEKDSLSGVANKIWKKLY
jgi:tRNA dimethylallyltransferase